MSMISRLTDALNTKITELNELRQKQQARILKAFSDSNNGMEPNEDRNGRLHAPCDGYEHFETGELYGKGQFIVMPEYDDWYSPASYPGKSYDPNTRFKGLTADYQETVKLMESFGLRVKTGRRWHESAQEYCYFTVTGHKPLIGAIAKTVEAIQAEQREHERQFKGVAPTGKATVKAMLKGVKMVESGFGRSIRLVPKMIITLDNGATAYGTMPKVLADQDAKAGHTFTLKATFEQDKNDKTHAYFTRPVVLSEGDKNA
ncbi:hypothetical protein [Citrobacter freundii]|uniref:hypothetical protein n=1 Tax=Citrobacter freundii TaxID=546 RepID=UPI0005CDADE3|nr:hypothetical protein [Citrobacter freundii]KJC04675.1 hypothetical protein TN42_24665 [Citrobacter freundii]HAZ7884345.1 hypothetical protein [Escherichia coli]